MNTDQMDRLSNEWNALYEQHLKPHGAHVPPAALITMQREVNALFVRYGVTAEQYDAWVQAEIERIRAGRERG